MLLRDLRARGRNHLGPTRSLPALPLVALDLHHQARDRCAAACLHLQRRIMWLPVPTILSSRRSSRRRQLMRNHSHLCTNSHPSSHPSLPVSRTPTTDLMLAVFRPHHPHHLPVSGVRQVRLLHKVLCLRTVFVPAALPPKFALWWRTEPRRRVTDIRAHTSTTPTLLLAVALLAEPQPQHQLKLLPSKLLAIVTSALLPHHQKGIASGKTLSTSAQSRLPMTRSVRRLKSLTAVAPRLHTACHRLRCRVRAHRMDLTPDGSTMVTTHRRLLTTHLRSLLWLLLDHCRACLRRPRPSDPSITSQPLATWTWTRITTTRVKRPSRVRQSLSEAAHAQRRRTA